MGDVTLVLGGIKSGKSSYAESKAYGEVVYLATGEALDDEMKQRIKHHRESRPSAWETVEEPLDIKRVMYEWGNKCDFILLDCLTLWLTNLLGRAGENYNREELMEEILNKCDNFLDSAETCKSDLVIVSNQAELGLVSMYKLGRLFQDTVGLLHQRIAKRAKNVIVLQAGIPTALKGEI